MKNLTNEEWKVILLCSLGGALEIYDFTIYIFLVPTLEKLFFPYSNQLISLMAALAIFAIGYFMRPLGGILFSHFGDRKGRKKPFALSIMLMALPTFLVAFLPTYWQVGIIAPLLLLFLRMVQGFAIGGEIPGAVIFTAEYVTPKFRGLACSIIFAALKIGFLLGSIMALIVTWSLSTEQLNQWGWRVPFLLGGVLGVIGYYLRKKVAETPIFLRMQQLQCAEKKPIFIVFQQHLPKVFRGIIIAGMDAVIVSLLFLFMSTYLIKILNYPKEMAELFNTLNLFLFSLTCILAGWLSDQLGRRVLLLISTIGFILFSYLFFYLLSQHSIPLLVLALVGFSIFGGCTSGVFACTLTELYPTPIRYTGVAMSYNFGFAIFAGATPLLATYLIKISGFNLAPSFYLTFVAFLAFLTTLKIPSRHQQPLATTFENVDKQTPAIK